MSFAVLAVGVSALGLSGCVADPPPIIGTATPGDRSAVVSWQAPVNAMVATYPITGYVVTPWIGFVRQTPVVFNSTATTQTVTGLTNGVTYTFTVVAINSLGNDSASSAMSNPVTPAPPAATAIDAGSLHTCAVLSDGTADCWGDNFNGQLGNGTTGNSSTPVAVTGMTNATAISAGGIVDDAGAHTCARLTIGTVQCWGYGYFGQLGNGIFTSSTTTPVTVIGITTATAVAAGIYHSCALLTGGTVNCWGFNGFGSLGNGTHSDASTPVVVTGITTATAISAGYEHSCALLTGGSVKCWGLNGSGQLGNGTTTNSSTPVTVTGITTAVAISAGGEHTCALLTSGTVNCWGGNASGQLGNGTTLTWPNPLPVTGITTATAISAGGYHTCALLTGGAAYCWGGNAVGQLGNGTTTNSTTAVPVTGITTAVVIDAGGYQHTCTLITGGAAYCWGFNNNGQLGNGTTTNSTTPVTVIGI